MGKEEHSHNHSIKGESKNIKVAFLLNLSFAIMEVFGGLFCNSISIISDSIHDFADSVIIGMSYILEKKSEKKPDEKYTYGYKRYSVLGALISAGILFVGGIFTIVRAIPRILNPQIVNSEFMIGFAIFGFIVNGIGAIKTTKGKGLNQKTICLHLFEDVLTWISVLIVSIGIKFFNMPILDPILSIGIGTFIITHAFSHLNHASAVFMEKAPDDIDISEIKKVINENDKIIEVHHVHLWSLDGVTNCITIHVTVIDSLNKDEIIEIKRYIREKVNEFNIYHITIDLEYESEKCDQHECIINEYEDD